MIQFVSYLKCKLHINHTAYFELKHIPIYLLHICNCLSFSSHKKKQCHSCQKKVGIVSMLVFYNIKKTSISKFQCICIFLKSACISIHFPWLFCSMYSTSNQLSMLKKIIRTTTNMDGKKGTYFQPSLYFIKFNSNCHLSLFHLSYSYILYCILCIVFTYKKIDQVMQQKMLQATSEKKPKNKLQREGMVITITHPISSS